MMRGCAMGFLALSLVVTGVANCSRGYDDPLLDQAAKGNSSTVGSIRTLYVKIHLKITPAGQQDPSTVFAGEFWKEPGLVRVREKCEIGCSGQIIEFEAADGRQRSVTRLPGPVPNTFVTSLLIAEESRPKILTNVWKFALMGLPPEGSESKPVLSVSEAASQMKIKAVASERGPEGKLVRLTLDDEKSRYDIWLDPKVNWMIRRVVRHIHKTARQSDRITEYMITDFAEVQPGIFFPTKMTMQSQVEGKKTVAYEAEFTAVAINTFREPPFPKKLPLYDGMSAADEIAGTTYSVDRNGNPAGKVSAIRYMPPLQQPAKPDPITVPESRWNRLLRPSTWLIGLAFGFASAAAILVYRRRRSERTT